MKTSYMVSIALLSISHIVSAQKDFSIVGKQFFAMTVSNVDSTSRWYEGVFSMKLAKEVKLEKSNLHVRILANEFLLIELLQMNGARSLKDCSISKDEGHLMRGIVKIGFYVSDLTAAEKYYKDKQVKFKYSPFEDKEMKVRAFLIEDPNGNLIQVMQSLDK